MTIARVILANPSILILDEATSSVDTRTEVEIQKAMDHLMKGTYQVLSSRIGFPLIRDADLILVMRRVRSSSRELIRNCLPAMDFTLNYTEPVCC